MVDVRLTYDKGLDKYYGLLDIAENITYLKRYQQDMNYQMVQNNMVSLL